MSKTVTSGVVTGMKFRVNDTMVGILTVYRDTDSEFYLPFKGFLPGVDVNSEIELHGTMATHPKYGPQLLVSSFKFKNATPEQEKICETLRYLHEDLGLKKRGEMIYTCYGTKAREIIEANPYNTAHDVPNVGIETAEKIADALDIPLNDPRRIDERVLYCLEKAAEKGGHVYLDHSTLITKSLAMMDETDNRLIEDSINRLLTPEQDSRRPHWLNTDPRLIKEGNDFYLTKLWRAESSISEDIKRILNAEKQPSNINDKELDAAFPDHSDPTAERLVLSLEQKMAVLMAIDKDITVITGGPGVGKTTIIKALVQLAWKRGWNMALCAPTGRAAKRMKETSGYEAATIHRTLSFDPSRGAFRFCRELPLSADIVICDEASMIDIELFSALLKGIPSHARVVFVGDVDQLPPVGPGAPFRDLIKSGQVPVIRLVHIFRQKESSLIIAGSQKILSKKVPIFGKPEVPTDDLFLFTYNNDTRGVAKVIELMTERIPKRFGISPEGVQILCPIKKGLMGTINLNAQLQNALQGKNAPKDSFLKNDRVIQLQNDYDLNVFNGDVGYVTRVQGEHITVEYPEGKVTYGQANSHNLALAYAITIHKSQGSEYQVAIVIGTGGPLGFYNRNMFYTAMTRGKKLTIIMAPAGTDRLERIVGTDEKPRRGHLLEKLSINRNDLD